MKIKERILTGLLIFIISFTGIAQNTQTPKKNKSSGNAYKVKAREQINQLKNGALLVRLTTKEHSLAALRKIGKTKHADELQKKQAAYNLKIIKAFRKNFDFCPVYFFFSNYSTNIRERQFDKVIFLNDSLAPDTSIKFTYNSFLTAEFGNIEEDTAKYYSYASFESDSNEGRHLVSHYYGGNEMGFGALLIRSDKFIQLRRPFPYYVRTFDSLPIERSEDEAVKMMNKEMHAFYKQSNK
jgi:hypothetical protein